MSQFNRPPLPTTGTTADEQRLRSGIGEIVRMFLESGAFLMRLAPGTIKRMPSSATGLVAVAEWGTLNRIAAAPETTVVLPVPRPKNIGIPLAVTKLYPTGVVHIRPTFGTDGKTPSSLDGSPTGITITRPGRVDLVSDGTDWSSGEGGNPVTEVISKLPIERVTASMLTLNTSHVRKYLRFENGCLVTVPSGVFAASDEFILRQAAAAQVILNQTGIGTSMQTGLIRPPASFKPILAEQGSTAALFVVNGATIDLTGHLERY